MFIANNFRYKYIKQNIYCNKGGSMKKILVPVDGSAASQKTLAHE